MQGKSVFFVLLWVIGGLGGDCGRGPIGRVNQSERLQLFGKTSKLAKIKTSTTVTTAATTTATTSTATATTATPVSGNTANVVAAVPRSGAIAIPLKNIAPRLTSAVVLLSTLTAAIGYFGLPALITVIIISQTIMSFETDSVVSRTIYPEDGGGEKTVPWLRAQKWMWFFGVFAGVTLPILLEEFGQEEMLLLAPTISFSIFLAALCTLIVSFAKVPSSPETPAIYRKHLALASTTTFMTAYFHILCGMMVKTANLFGIKFVVIPVLLTAINDTFAYIFGCLFGKSPMFVSISPKKTWEGFFGGAAATVLLGHLLWEEDVFLWVAIFASIIGPFGGFAASVFKRSCGVKDFSNLIPGHGGVTDRLDCQVIVGGFTWLVLDMLDNV